MRPDRNRLESILVKNQPNWAKYMLQRESKVHKKCIIYFTSFLNPHIKLF